MLSTDFSKSAAPLRPTSATSTASSTNPPILSSAGFFCKDTVSDIKDGLIKIIENKNIVKSKIIKGKKISNKFKWDITSKNTFKFLENLDN